MASHEFEPTPGVGDGQKGLALLQSMGSQWVGQKWVTELNWTDLFFIQQLLMNEKTYPSAQISIVDNLEICLLWICNLIKTPIWRKSKAHQWSWVWSPAGRGATAPSAHNEQASFRNHGGDVYHLLGHHYSLSCLLIYNFRTYLWDTILCVSNKMNSIGFFDLSFFS